MAIRLSKFRDAKSDRWIVEATDHVGTYLTQEDAEFPEWPELLEMSLIARSAESLVEKLDTMNRDDTLPPKRKEAQRDTTSTRGRR